VSPPVARSCSSAPKPGVVATVPDPWRETIFERNLNAWLREKRCKPLPRALAEPAPRSPPSVGRPDHLLYAAYPAGRRRPESAGRVVSCVRVAYTSQDRPLTPCAPTMRRRPARRNADCKKGGTSQSGTPDGVKSDPARTRREQTRRARGRGMMPDKPCGPWGTDCESDVWHGAAAIAEEVQQRVPASSCDSHGKCPDRRDLRLVPDPSCGRTGVLDPGEGLRSRSDRPGNGCTASVRGRAVLVLLRGAAHGESSSCFQQRIG
jgi:hypothetical protein